MFKFQVVKRILARDSGYSDGRDIRPADLARFLGASNYLSLSSIACSASYHNARAYNSQEIRHKLYSKQKSNAWSDLTMLYKSVLGICNC